MPPQNELPDDLQNWPNDPMVLFRIGPEATRRDLKQAYVRLIRRFKPEHAPEQFRRLREAFEQLDQQLKWREMFSKHALQAPPPDETPETEESEPVIQPDRQAEETVIRDLNLFPINHRVQSTQNETGSRPTSNRRIPPNDAEVHWQQALVGRDLKTVYLELKDLAKQRAVAETDFVRLYWLLTLHPEFDEGCDASAWLIAGLQQHGSGNRLLPMLSLDVVRRHGGVSQVLTEDLLDDRFLTDAIIELAQIRWAAARAFSRFDIIALDLDRLRERFVGDTDHWLRLLYEALRKLVVVNNETAEKLLKMLCEEFASLPATFEADWIWNRYESLTELNNAWGNGARKTRAYYLAVCYGFDFGGRPLHLLHPDSRQALPTLERLTKLIETTWEMAPFQARPFVLLFCHELTKNLKHGLYDLMAIMQRLRPLILRLLELIREQASELFGREFLELSSAAEKEVEYFIRGKFWHHENWLLTALKFCSDEGTTPHDIANALDKNQDWLWLPESGPQIAAILREHLPLLCMVEAQRLLWI